MTFLKSIFFLFVVYLWIGARSTTDAQQIAYHHSYDHDIEISLDNKLQDKPYKSEFFRVRGIPKVTVHSTIGNVEVVQNPDIEGVKVDLFLERSFSLWSGRRGIENFRIILQQQGNHIIASVEDKKSGHVPSDRDTKFHFVVQTPEKVNTNLRTFEGDILLENVEGDHFIQNQSGSIIINRTKGEIRVASTMGNIDLAYLEGKVFAKTVNGNVNITSNSGEARIRSVSGNITASDITGALVSATTSGNIFADFLNVSQGIFLESLSGDIELFLPLSTGYNIEGSAASYDLRGLNESMITQRNQNQQSLNMTIKDGGLPVHLSTLSGRIRVSESQ